MSGSGIEPEERPDNLGKLGVWGASTNRLGPYFPIPCPDCGKQLSEIRINDKCTIDIRIECAACGGVAEGRNLRADYQGKMGL